MPSDDLFAERRRKVDELAARGIPSYGVDFAPTATTDEARRLLNAYEAEHPGADVDAPDRPVVAVAGRIMQLRDLGGAAFAHVEDEFGSPAGVVSRRSPRRRARDGADARPRRHRRRHGSDHAHASR